MKTITPCRFAAIFALGLICASSARGQSITVEMIDHLKQTGAGTTVANGSLPYAFEVHIDSNSGAVDVTNWGPSFAIPSPGTGTSANTNTGGSTFQSNVTLSPNKNSSGFVA